MKIGIVTLYGNTNYGNRLQNYAIQEILKQRGYEVETLVVNKNTPKDFLRKTYHTVMSLLGDKQSKRMARFDQFNKEMVQTRIIYNKSGLLPREIAKEYDFFVSGSDQVWNPDIRLNEKDNFFLRFARREQRICLAPSIATEEIPQTCMVEYEIGLNGFPYLSCREKNGAEAISRITGRNCENIIDPTLAIDAQTWRGFSKPISQEQPYILMFFLGKVSDKLRQLVQMEAKKRQMDVVELSSERDKFFVSNPQNLVWLIDHAELVLTDSFHGAAFSINMNTPFYVFNRVSKKVAENRIASRIAALTEKFCLSERYIEDELKELNFSCCFEYGNNVLEEERKRFQNYLDRCLSQRNWPLNLLPDRRCTGCGACEQVCPKGCIKMKYDAEGFLRPALDQKMCISCKKCTETCPVMQEEALATNELRQIVAAIYNNQDKLNQCSSGAIFPLMAEWVIGQNGVVFGAAFDNEFDVTHGWAEKEDEIKRFYTSKYVQSNIQECYAKVAKFLKEGRLVLFSGTPCQLAGIRSYLGREYEGLILVECACHGVPSPKVWKAYKTYLSKVHLNNEQINYVNFREKVDGQLFFLQACSKNYEYVDSYRANAYFKGFLNNLILRPSCTECSFKGTYRVADITLADFWGINSVCPEFPQKNGCSMVMINSVKGEKVWESIACEELCSQSVSKEKVVSKVNSAVWKSVPEHNNRRAFFNSFEAMGIEKALIYYGTSQKSPFIKRVLRKVKKILTRHG